MMDGFPGATATATLSGTHSKGGTEDFTFSNIEDVTAVTDWAPGDEEKGGGRGGEGTCVRRTQVNAT